jgi:hypothetical protein
VTVGVESETEPTTETQVDIEDANPDDPGVTVETGGSGSSVEQVTFDDETTSGSVTITEYSDPPEAVTDSITRALVGNGDDTGPTGEETETESETTESADSTTENDQSDDQTVDTPSQSTGDERQTDDASQSTPEDEENEADETGSRLELVFAVLVVIAALTAGIWLRQRDEDNS